MYKYRFIFLEFNILVIFFDVINLKKKLKCVIWYVIMKKFKKLVVL